MEQDIAHFILKGIDNARTADTIAQITQQSKRTVMEQIEQARKRGTLICSDCEHGYWLPVTPAEARHTVAKLRRRAVNQLQTAKGMELGLIAFDAAYMEQQAFELD